MGKGFFVVGIIVLVFAGVLGVLYFIGVEQAQAPEAPAYTIPPEEMRNPDEIVVEGNRFSDTRQRYSGIIPEGWEIIRPTLKAEPISVISETAGCRLNSGFLPTNETPEQLIEKLKQDPIPFLTIKKFEIVDISITNISGKKVFLDSIEQGYSEAIYLGSPNQTFQFSMYSFGNDQARCSKIFRNFYESIEFGHTI